jgi:hypothetical protein
VDLDEEVIQSRPYVEGEYPGFYYVDGSPAEGIPGSGSGKDRNPRKYVRPEMT